MAASQPANFNLQEFTDAGLLLVGGRLYTYFYGTTTHKTAYTDPTGAVPHTYTADGSGGQYIALNARGELPSSLYLSSGAYDISLRRADSSTVWTRRAEPSGDSVAALASANGAAQIGSAAWYAGAITGFNASAVPNGATIIFSGRDAAGDGNGGVFTYAKTSTQSADGGMVFAPAGGGRLIRNGWTVVGFNGAVNANWWGAKRDGSNDTTKLQAAIDATISMGVELEFVGHYAVDMLTVKDAVYNFSINCTEATFDGIAATARVGVFNIVNCVGFNIRRPRISSANNNFYESALSIRAQAGTSQSTTRIVVDQPVIRNFIIGISIGRYDIDYQCSEITVFGANFFGCPIAVYVGGSQTGASFVGCNLVSEPNAGFSGVPGKVIWMEGGFVSVSGGSIVKAVSPTGESILLNPCLSALYSSPYAILRIGSLQIESACPLLTISNPRALATPRSSESNFTVIGCGGYASPDGGALDFMSVADATYAGLIQATDCNFYCLGTPRTAYNISSVSPLTRVITDSTSFNTGFKHWLGGVSGGIVLHDLQPVVSASGLGVTLGAGPSTLKYVNNIVTYGLARYGVNYDPTTGKLTIPPGGFSTLDITAGAVGGDASTNDMFVNKNGVTVAYGHCIAGAGTVHAVLHDLVAGDYIEIKLRQTTGGAFDTSALQTLKISGATT